MRVLWLVNSPFPEALQLLTGKESTKKGSGGWQIAAAEQLSQEKGIKMWVASSSMLVKKMEVLQGALICHIILPRAKDESVQDAPKMWRRIINEYHPDIVHIHGTEYHHGISFINSIGSDNVVVSVQGLVSVIAGYYNSGITNCQMIKNLTLYDVLRHQSLFDAERRFNRNGAIEIETLKRVSHVIGRTTWDNVHIKDINPQANYYHCNESLRNTFYDGVWQYNSCIKHRIFLSQASYPVKGLHIALRAFALVRDKYPDIKVSIAGPDFIHPIGLKARFKNGGYAKLIRSLIKKNSLDSIISFTGPLDAEQMKAEYLKANVFVCPSTIENSPNSLGEAQILGVPSVASFVGGIPDFIPNHNCGELYRFEEYKMLAHFICKLFESSPSFDNTEMRRVASLRHNREQNTKRLLDIYKIVQASR